MTEVEDPTETPRRLRVELVRQRERAGLAPVEAAGRLDWPVERLQRIEAGSAGVSIADVHALLCAYRSAADVVDELVGLARLTRERRWWNDYRQSLTREYQQFIGYEAEAIRLRQFHPTIIPGLLQTEGYVRAILPGVALQPIAAERIQALVEVRLRRQQEILHGDNPRELSVVIDEGALHRLVGGAGTMAAQLDHLVMMQAHPQVSIAVLPFGIGGHAGMQGAFHIMELAGDDEFVLFLETGYGNVAQTDPNEVTPYRSRLAEMLRQSLRGDQAVDRLRAIAAQLS
jgi:Domain of unknown function (DUF5753)/Helix-turn-helix domain